jgi:DDE family transposase
MPSLQSKGQNQRRSTRGKSRSSRKSRPARKKPATHRRPRRKSASVRGGRRPASTPASDLSQLREHLSRQLPRRGLPLIAEKKSARWSPRLLVFAAILFTLDASATLGERFAAAYDAITAMFPSRRRAGKDPQGFLRALCRHSAELLEIVKRRLRRRVRVVAGRTRWRVEDHLAFGVDGSRVECPRTAANEKAMGCAGRDKTTPQLFVTTLFHLGTGLVWDFCRGIGTASERSHMLSMLDKLPKEALLLADAGFNGYDFMTQVLASGRHLLIRAGGNVKLLRKLGWYCREKANIVYLWPSQMQKKQGCAPLVLRLITLRDGRNKTIHLLSDLLETKELSDAQAGRLYRLRWGVEVLYRSLKQTLGKRKMVCRSPDHAAVELDWAMISLWGLSLLTVEELGDSPPAQLSIAKALRPVRRIIRSAPLRHDKALTLAGQLALAVRDSYSRKSAKRSRNPVSKKKDPLPKAPLARMASNAEKARAQALLQRNTS